MKIESVCKSYFNGFREVRQYKKNPIGITALALLKILSYFTVVIPLCFAALSKAASLCNRVVSKGRVVTHSILNRFKWISSEEVHSYVYHCYGSGQKVSPLRQDRSFYRIGPLFKDVRDMCIPILDQTITRDYKQWKEDQNDKTLFSYPFQYKNHWMLVIVDHKKRTLEFYDSKATYGGRHVIDYLTKLTQDLSAIDPNSPYQFVQKITKSVQPDSYQCGIWLLYFLKKRIEEPDFDFNTLILNVADSQRMIAEHRLYVQAQLIESDRINQQRMKQLAEEEQAAQG